jgi:hypothetical protein
VWGLGVVLDAQLHHAGGALIGQPLGQVQGHVDAGRYPGRGDELAVLDPSLGQVGGAQAFQQAVVGPVGGGGAALQQAGGGKDQRAGADRPDHRGGVGGLAQVVADHLVAHGLDRGRAAAGDEHDLRVGDVAEGAVGGDGERSVGGHGHEPLGHHHWPVLVVELPQAGEDLQRADQIQQREAWVEHERHRLLLLGCHHLPFRCWGRM